MLKGKKIVLGITGSIAAYKSCLLIREFIKQGAEVQVVITPAGKEFITPITLSALTHKPVVSEFFSQRDGTWNSHVDLGLWADAMVIAPCTASTLGKMAHGIADNMLITTYLSMKAPVFVAPAMDLDMYRHPSTQANMLTMQSYGNMIVEPASGFLASGLEGKGRMEEPAIIAQRVSEYFDRQDSASPLKGKKVMITAGPVSLSCSSAISRIDVESCEQMYAAATSAFNDSDVAILAAAVADFRPATVADQKIKRGNDDMTIQLCPNHDIAAALGAAKKPEQTIVAFALETNDEEANAQRKLEKKNADFIVLNSLQNKGTCFRTDDNQIEIISRQGKKAYPKCSKAETAQFIVDELERVVEGKTRGGK